MTRRTLEELNLLDDFLFQEVISRGEKGEEVCRILLSIILDKKIGQVTVTPQKPILGRDTTLRGIRMDAYIEAVSAEETTGTDVKVDPDIYDIEPNKTLDKGILPKRTRYYQALIDSRLLDTGTDYEKLKNVVIIMILPFDPFDEDRMVYTVKNHCVEEDAVSYEDGVTKIFLYTRGTKGNPSQELQELLKYIENSTAENVTNETLSKLDSYVKEVKQDKEVGIQYMKSWERERMIREEARREGRREGEEAGKTAGVMEVAKQLLDILDITTIVEKTGLPLDVVQELAKKQP